jgi:hypothetical protein
MLVMSLLILAIDLLQDIMNLLLEVLDPFIEFGYFFCLNLSVGALCQGSWNGQSYISGGQWIGPQTHMKRVVANRAMEGSIIAMLNIWEALIPCKWMLRVVHAQDMHNHPIDHLSLSICLGMKGSQFG